MGKWELVRLGDIGTIVTGSTPPKKEAIFYDSDDIPFFKPNDFSENTIEKLAIPNEYVSEKARKKIRLLPVGSVLVTCIGTIGKVGIATCESTCNQQINAIIPHDKVITSEYLANVVLTRRAYLKQIANAPVVPIINKSNFSEVLIPLPPLDEQKRIAKNLDLASEIVKGYKEQLADLDKLVQSVFYEMFGDPVTNEKGWAKGTIRDVVQEVKYGTSRPATEGGKYTYLRMNNITTSGHLDLSNLKQIDIPDNELEKCMVKYGDVLFNRTNSKELVGKTCVYNLPTQMIIAGYIIRVRVNEKMLPEFLSAILNSKYGKNTLSGMCKSIIGQANINAQELQSINIFIPPIQMQTCYVKIVTKIEAQKAQIQQALTEAENLFNSLMQEYFE